MPIKSRFVRLCLTMWLALPFTVAIGEPFDKGRAAISVDLNGRTSGYREFFTTALPTEKVSVKIVRKEQGGDYTLFLDDRLIKSESPGLWHVTAPGKPGNSLLKIKRAKDGSEAMRIVLFTMVSATQVNKSGVLNNYRIGHYPSKPYKGLASYAPPRGYIEVTEANRSLKIAPHFTLEQFLCKQVSGYPKYLVLRPGLLAKLEDLLADVNERGIRADSFHVMSGYRTPYYNAAIRNVENSRHVWGGAADIFIDSNPVDGMMDDLNGDGKIDKADAMLLYNWADTFVRHYKRPDLVGGVGAYGSNASHGPFVHIDVRGQKARWGAE